jgi:hypothetical protein
MREGLKGLGWLPVKGGNATMRFVFTKDIELKQFFRGPIWQLRD